MITMTDSAISAVRRFMQSSEAPMAGLRIKVEGGGCSGFQYGMKLEENVTQGDEVLDFSGLTVLVDENSAALLEGVTVDFVDGFEGSGFKFENPNASNSCGCGKSFSA
ncbi:MULTISPECIES: iron-sulfur cluster assembly accessory protein [unclassified Oceanobacter]|jgi:iron-sulfur cluster assembly protein|uniref:HesB/IscA family protein n=1 Tax=unclassified Oceanobacter TaxID=2620260 RepID=UPI0026E22C19|nr:MULTISPECIES: iron-sulfur cluster assembly accessory protein [unclassified Oceanobacter]MDO6682727.1 iron-sulfur cluster assembly accessory protein [Oceanobacter sp. 5_MG-2023]MDP2507205.1 iron-sulfur cluster assembly accessory protein [Oceanobacter sp. 3_MG-2023]MDP2549125.1 iron-sulfur cluster assembly accessory protein [Oceanobacter sp. 4_MG-2023]MDP2609035.1 iron-sulfur cluster assembly accessory protein [Oceanobacter sp. 1_MG-2023]MDP2612357.1 iron-sulfur cluster assembly accessory pro